MFAVTAELIRIHPSVQLEIFVPESKLGKILEKITLHVSNSRALKSFRVVCLQTDLYSSCLQTDGRTARTCEGRQSLNPTTWPVLSSVISPCLTLNLVQISGLLTVLLKYLSTVCSCHSCTSVQTAWCSCGPCRVESTQLSLHVSLRLFLFFSLHIISQFCHIPLLYDETLRHKLFWWFWTFLCHVWNTLLMLNVQIYHVITALCLRRLSETVCWCSHRFIMKHKCKAETWLQADFLKLLCFVSVVHVSV